MEPFSTLQDIVIIYADSSFSQGQVMLRDNLEGTPGADAVRTNNFIFYVKDNSLVPVSEKKLVPSLQRINKLLKEADARPGNLSYRRKRLLLKKLDKHPPSNFQKLQQQVGECVPLPEPPPLDHPEVIYALYIEFLLTEPTEKEMADWLTIYPMDKLNPEHRKVVMSMFYQLYPNNIIEYLSNTDVENQYTDMVKIGEGAYGKVYKAVNNKSKETVALKFYEKKIKQVKRYILSEYHMSLLIKEDCMKFSCMSRLIETDKHYITETKYIDGKDLFTILTDEKISLTLEHKLKMSNDIIETTKLLHRYNLVHRDIKLENIMYHHDSNPEKSYTVLVDYNFSCKNPISPGNVTPCREDEYVGTLSYLEHSRITRNKENSYQDWLASDNWTVGLVLYEIWTLRGIESIVSSNIKKYIDPQLPVYDLSKLAKYLKVPESEVVPIILDEVGTLIEKILNSPSHNLPSLQYLVK